MSDLRVDYFVNRFRKTLFLKVLEIVKENSTEESYQDFEILSHLEDLTFVSESQFTFHSDSVHLSSNCIYVSSDTAIFGFNLFKYNYIDDHILMIGDETIDHFISSIMKRIIESEERE